MLLVMPWVSLVLFLFLTLTQAPAPLRAQETPATSGSARSTLREAAVGTKTTSPLPGSDGTAVQEPAQQPQIVVNAPPSASPWTWHDQVLWGANLVLVILGYLGILLAL